MTPGTAAGTVSVSDGLFAISATSGSDSRRVLLRNRRPPVVEPLTEAGGAYPLHVFLELATPDHDQLLVSFVVVLFAAPQQNRQRFGRLGKCSRGVLYAGQHLRFRFVEVVLDLFASFGSRLREVTQVHYAERDVARFVLRAQSIH